MIFETNRNVSIDNWFSYSDLADKLLQIKLNMLGTTRKNKPYIPPHFLIKRKIFSCTDFVYYRNKTLECPSPMKAKNAILLSTFNTLAVVDEKSKKSEIVLFYNCTNRGIDTYE